MTTPRQFEEKIAKAIENGDDNMQIITSCIGVMVETLDSLGYQGGTDVFKAYMDKDKCR